MFKLKLNIKFKNIQTNVLNVVGFEPGTPA